MHCSLFAEAVLACTWAEAELAQYAHCPLAVPVKLSASPAAGLWVGSSAIFCVRCIQGHMVGRHSAVRLQSNMTVVPFCYLVQLI